MTTITGHTTRANGTILSAAIYNADHVNHVTNATALNTGKIEGATPPVVDGDIVVFDGTGGAAVRSFGDPPLTATDVAALIGGFRAIADISGGGTIIAGDRGKLVQVTTGTGTLAFTAAATLGATFFCQIKNAGTGNVTLNPDGTETIDGLTSWILYPGGTIQLFCDGTNFFSTLLSPMQVTYDASDTFTTPGVGTWAEIEGWGAGGSGARGTAAETGGGGGGGYTARKILRSALGATETGTIGAGGASRTSNSDGATGGNSTFGAHLTAYGGGGGDNAGNGGGGGGGQLSAGLTPSVAGGGEAGLPWFLHYRDDVFDYMHGRGGDGEEGIPAFWHGGGGGDGADIGGISVYGGGGGGGCTTTAAAAGGGSSFGGPGGAGNFNGGNATAGSQPAGGGGASEGVATGNSGAGGAGRITVRIY